MATAGSQNQAELRVPGVVSLQFHAVHIVQYNTMHHIHLVHFVPQRSSMLLNITRRIAVKPGQVLTWTSQERSREKYTLQ